MKITIIGTGYVGLVTGTCLAEVGHEVFCLDVDQAKIDLLNNGGIPIFEPGLEALVKKNKEAGRLQFSTDVPASVKHGQVQFIAVGTPPDEDGSADLQYVLAAARNIGKYMDEYKVVVDKSTVPVGTGDKVQAAIQDELQRRSSHLKFAVVSNPEFLKEGAAVADFMQPDRIVVGHANDEAGLQAQKTMQAVYQAFMDKQAKVFWMDIKSAEFTKYAANAMLATRISFMNELSNLADVVGVDIEAVRKGIGSDPRIGPSFLLAGCGYGGSCFPKDVQALGKTAQEHGFQLQILDAVENVNELQKQVLPQKVLKYFGSDLRGLHFAVLGLAFKPNTDDMREASSRVLIAALLKAGASMTVYDPVAIHEAQRVLALDLLDTPDLLKQIRYAESAAQCLQQADALIVVTEWDDFKKLTPQLIKSQLKQAIVFDGRNIYEPTSMKAAGIQYQGIGRAVLNAPDSTH